MEQDNYRGKEDPMRVQRFFQTAAILAMMLSHAADLQAGGRPVRVFILAGQSNMEGQGVVEMDHPKYYNGGQGNLVWSMQHSRSTEKMRHLKDDQGRWTVRGDVRISFKNKNGVRTGPLTIGYTGYGGKSHIGPELQFGHVIGDYCEEDVLLIKTAWGGKSLHADFRPPRSGGVVGPYYKKMIEEVRAALAALGDTPHVISGFVWLQGWNDMFNENARNEYQENLVNLAFDVRREFDAPALPFVIGELGNGGPQAGDKMKAIRNAQKEAADVIDNAVFVSTTAFARPKELSPNTGHGHHWFGNAESYFLIGDALGKGMVSLLGKKTPRDWPRWRGPAFDGTAEAGKYPVDLDPAKALWKAEVPGRGFSTPVIWNKRIYLTAGVEGQDTVFCFDFTGRTLWRKSLGKEREGRHRNASGSNPSVATDGRALFVFFKSGTLASLGLDGTVFWKHNLFERFGGDKRFWDFGTSPVLTEEAVVMAQMHAGDSYIAAFDKKTGKLKWKVARNYKTPLEGDQSYTTPIVYSRKDLQALLVWGGLHLTAHDASDGSVIWSCGGFNPESKKLWPVIASPVIAGDIAVLSCGRADRRQPRFHGIKMGGAGDVTTTHRLWKRKDVGSFVPTPAACNGKIYLVTDSGDVHCIDPRTGKTVWNDSLPRRRGAVYTSPLIAGDHLYVLRETGFYYVVSIKDAFEVVSKGEMNERVIASPVAVAGRIFVRGRRTLFCFGKQ